MLYSKDHPLYFIALLLPEPLAKELRGLKELFRDKYQSKASLNSPPHITLYMPFRWPDKKKELLVQALNDLAQKHTAFKTQLEDFGAFSPRVIFADVKPNPELEELQKDMIRVGKRALKLEGGDYKNRAFHPHITLAFRDLKKARFFEAWDDFKARSFKADFEVNKFYLMKHNGTLWQEDRYFGFRSKE